MCFRMEAKELHSMGRAITCGAGSGCTLPCFAAALATLPGVPDRWFMAPPAFILSLDEYRLVRDAYADLTLRAPLRRCGIFATALGIS